MFNYRYMSFIKFSTLKKKWLKDPEFKKQYDALEPEFALIKMIISKRLQKGLSQKALAKKLGVKQPFISRLEGGTYNPSVKFLHKLAKALDSKLNIKFL